jgi:hypothetical protein
MDLLSNYDYQIATIDFSEDDDLSSAVECLGQRLAGLVIPSTWGTSNITFQGSVDGGATYFPLEDEDDNPITWTAVEASKIVYILPLSPAPRGLTHLKIVSTTAQTEDQDIGVILEAPR